MTTALIVGCGYLGRRAGRLLAGRDYRVLGTVRTRERADDLPAWGIEPILADVLDLASLDRLPAADLVLHCVGFDRRAGVPMRDVYVQGLRNVLDRLAGRVGRLVFASSTGVYGQTNGQEVDEESPAEPVSQSGRVVREAERVVETYRAHRGLDAVILRYAGLYGPGRVLRRASLERGEPVPGDPDHWLNLIQIDDAATCALAALLQRPPSPIYNAADDRPVLRREFYRAVAAYLNAPEPRFASGAPDPGQNRRDATNKRVANRRIKTELGVQLAFPDFTTGIPAALADVKG